MLSQLLLDTLSGLVCPACKKPLVLKEDEKSVKCTVCRRVYPIRDELPIMLIDDATIDPS